MGNGVMSDAKKIELTQLAQRGKKTTVSGTKGLATTGHPLSTQVAIDVLMDGGNAVDAIVAAAVANNVVEPLQSSLAGLMVMQYYEASSGKIFYLDANNNAPRNLPMTQADWDENAATYLRDGRSATVPGFWGGVEEALCTFGTMSKERLIAPAVDFARNGVEASEYLIGSIAQLADNLGITDQAREIFMPNGCFICPGDKFYQTRVADLLERLITEGNNYYYHGGFAEQVCAGVQASGGWLTMDDFAAYDARWLEPVSTQYRGLDLFAPCAPLYGGQVLAEIFNVLDLMDLERLGPAAQSGETAWRMKQIIRLVSQQNKYWHRNNNKPELLSILSKEFAAERLASLPDFGLPEYRPSPPGSSAHTVTDGDGNVATMFHTTHGSLSNGLYVDGVHISPAAATYFNGIPNPGERLNVCVGSAVFLKNKKPFLVATSPSMSTIECMVQCCSNVLDFGMSIEQATHLPRFGGDIGTSIPGAFKVEVDMPESTFNFLRDKKVPFEKIHPWHPGHGVFEAIAIDDKDCAHACGDPRRVGQAFAVPHGRGSK